MVRLDDSLNARPYFELIYIDTKVSPSKGLHLPNYSGEYPSHFVVKPPVVVHPQLHCAMLEVEEMTPCTRKLYGPLGF